MGSTCRRHCRAAISCVLADSEFCSRGLSGSKANTAELGASKYFHGRQKIRALTDRIEAIAERMPSVQSLRTVPGVGVLTATALVAFVGEPYRFRSGRHFASYLGLTPRENSSGFRRRLGRISKRGNTYLRMMLTHGARSALLAARRTHEPDSLQRWALRVELRCGHNKATVALANRLARIAWRVWRDQRAYERLPVSGRPGQGGPH